MTVYYKMRQILLQNATTILLQNVTEVYYKMRQVFYYKMRQFYYKMQVIIKCYVFTSCDSVSSQSKYEIKDSKTIYLDLTVMSKKINRTLAIEQRFPCRVSL